MNPLFLPTLLLSVALFFAGLNLARWRRTHWVGPVSLIAAIPAILLAAYYTRLFGEAKWFYTFRSWPFTELSGAGIGLLAGWLQFQWKQSPRAKKMVSAFFLPGLMLLCVTVPYLKQIFLRPDWENYSDRWSEGVCLQSSESSCGPASAATLLHGFGKTATEKEIARESFTTRRGTENWYLLRTIRRCGLEAAYRIVPPGIDHLQHPAIAGVKLNDLGGVRHFIAIWDESDGKYVIGDPLNGRETLSREELAKRYTFTGFYIVVSNTPAKE